MPLAALAADPVETNPPNYITLVENDRVQVVEHSDMLGDHTAEHAHPAFMLYALASFERRVTLPDGTVPNRAFAAGDVMFSEAQIHVGENTGTTPSHALIVELK